MPSEQDILDTLRKVIDPKTNQDIVALGLIDQIKINDGKVTLQVKTQRQDIQQKAQEAILELKGISAVKINIQQSSESSSTTNNLSKVRHLIAVSSCKGGVGKSTIAVLMAQELASQGHKVGLVDMDIYGPSLPTLFDLHKHDVYTNEQKHLIPIEKDNIKLMSFGFLLGDQAAILRGPVVTRYVQQILLGTAWGELDFLLLDMPPGTGDVHLTITQTVRLNGAIIVTTPHTLSLIDVARGILMFEKLSVPILGVIENMSYFQANEADEKHYIFGKNAGNKLKEKFGIDLLAEIPIDPVMTQSIHQYTPNPHINEAVKHTIKKLDESEYKSKSIPTITCDDKNIQLKWEDGREQTVSNFILRLNSQDALSINEITGEKLIKEEDIPNDIKATKVTPLGNYALGIEWSDGHKAGIYTYALIDSLTQSSNA